MKVEDMAVLAVNAVQLDEEPAPLMAVVRVVSALAVVGHRAGMEMHTASVEELVESKLVKMTRGGLVLTGAGQERLVELIAAA